MKILLLQDHLYLPTFGGGIKANRLLAEGLARMGHECAAIGPALTTRAGPTRPSEFFEAMEARGIEARTLKPGLYSYRYRGVQVDAMDFPTAEQSRRHILRRLGEFRPDRVLVNDDKRRLLLKSAIPAVPDKVVLVLQTIVNLPFGPLAADVSPEQTELMRKARGIVVISNYLKDYVETHLCRKACFLPLPVYGEGPFPNLGRFDRGFVTMINPCVEKGLSLFLGLAQTFPRVTFAAVPTWGADEALRRTLATTTNVRILEPVDDIEEILAQTRVLLAPSLWPETFGYIVPEAMARGIPVLASDIGGLREAKLGVDYLLPVTPAQRQGNAYLSPPQDLAPWRNALQALLTDPQQYEACSRKSREAALEFIGSIQLSAFEEFLEAPEACAG